MPVTSGMRSGSDVIGSPARYCGRRTRGGRADHPGGAAVSAGGDNSVDIWQSSFWKNPWVITIVGGVIACIIWAAIDEIRKKSSWWKNPPVIAAAVGVLALIIWAAAHPSPTTTASTNTARTPGPKNPGPTPTTPISPGPTSTGPAAFTRAVGITFSGIDFDSNPLASGPNNITWERYTYTLQGYGSVIVSRYPSSGALPTEAACRSWAQAHNSQILSGVNRGDRLCFITQNGRTVRFIVTNISNDAVEGQATIWNDGNQ